MAPQITLYLDFISPYAYLGWWAARRIDRVIDLRPEPVLFAALLGHWGQLGPAEIEPKRQFTFKDAVRRAAGLGAPIDMPAGHPFNPLLPLRLCQPQVAGDRQLEMIDVCYDAIWARRVNPMDAGAMARSLDGAGFDGAKMVARTQDPEAKSSLREATSRAIAAGVFGVPTFVTGGEHFFGHDRIDDVLRFLDGEDPVTDAQREGISNLQSLAQRTVAPKSDAK